MTQLTAYHILLHASSCLYISILNTDSLRPVRHTTGIFTYKNKNTTYENYWNKMWKNNLENKITLIRTISYSFTSKLY